MTTGEKLRAARLEAGMSQRQLCGDMITRNMLSLIENGSASPSMATLQYLAGRLGKSVSYFLQERAVDSPNPERMAQARHFYGLGQYTEALALLECYQGPDPLFDQEQAYLFALCALAQGEKRLPGQEAAVAQWLEAIDRQCLYYRPEQELSRKAQLQWAYAALEEAARQRQDYENAYLYACRQRTL